MADRYAPTVRLVQEDTALRTLVEQPPCRPTLAKLAEAVAALPREKTRLMNDWPVCNPEELARVAADQRAVALPPHGS